MTKQALEETLTGTTVFQTDPSLFQSGPPLFQTGTTVIQTDSPLFQTTVSLLQTDPRETVPGAPEQFLRPREVFPERLFVLPRDREDFRSHRSR